MDAFPRVPDQTRSMRKIPGVAHGDHRIVEKAEISLTVNGNKRCSVNKHCAPQDKYQCGEGNDPIFCFVEFACGMIHVVSCVEFEFPTVTISIALPIIIQTARL